VDSRAPPSTLVVLQTLGRGGEVLSNSTVEIYRFFIHVIGTITFFFFVRDHSTEIDNTDYYYLLNSDDQEGLKCPGTRS